MSLPPRKPYRVPHVRIVFEDGSGTTRSVFEPIYVVPLLERLHRGVGSKLKVTPQKLSSRGPGGRPWPEDMRRRVASLASEEARLARLYAKHPQSKDPVFEAVYGQGRFAEAFARVVRGRWLPGEAMPEPRDRSSDLMSDEEPVDATGEQTGGGPVDHGNGANAPEGEAPAAPEDPSELEAIRQLTCIDGLSTELARAVVQQLGVTRPADVAQLPLDELESVAGIGKSTARKIRDAAQMQSMVD
jgi:predicted flap endonuclease-1-like 5' DNA nuclease